jgi:hypothetical protein
MYRLAALLMLGALAVGISLDRRRRLEQVRLTREDLSRWEDEGGAVYAHETG